jgi:hypothetical protein
LSDLPKDALLRRQRAHDVASILGSLHMDGLDVNPEVLTIAQLYVDGEISISKMRAAISMCAASAAFKSLLGQGKD